jgi:hypothetical protein
VIQKRMRSQMNKKNHLKKKMTRAMVQQQKSECKMLFLMEKRMTMKMRVIPLKKLRMKIKSKMLMKSLIMMVKMLTLVLGILTGLWGYKGLTDTISYDNYTFDIIKYLISINEINNNKRIS